MHRIAPSPAMLAAAMEQAAAAPAGALAPQDALQLLLLQPKRQFKPPAATLLGAGHRPAGELQHTGAAADAVTCVLGRHLQPALGGLSASQLHRLVAAAGALGAPPPPGFAGAAAAALQGRMVLLPRGRQLVSVLHQLMAWGYRPSPLFMRAVHAAADLLLDSFSAASAFEFLGLCWEAAAPGGGRLGLSASAGGTALAPLPPRELVSELLASLKGRALPPEGAAQGLRLLGALRVRPPPSLLAEWFDACGAGRRGARGGAPAAELPPRLLLGALWGAAELRVAPPAAWINAVLEVLAPPGRLSACAPATLAGLLRSLLQLGVVPAPVFAAAAAEAAAAMPAASWDAESLSVLLGCLALWDAPPPAGVPLRELALRAGAAAAALASGDGDGGGGPGGGASAARLFFRWQMLRGREDAARLLEALEPQEALSIDLAMWAATLRFLPDELAGGGTAGGGSGGDAQPAALPAGALAPLFTLGVGAALRDPPLAPPTWFEHAWSGAAAAAAAADALSAAEAAALLGAAVGAAPGLHLWDLGVAQAVLRAGYRAREGAPAEALQALGFAGDAVEELAESVPAYAASWAAACAEGRATPSGPGGGPGLPPACAAALAEAYQAAAAAEADAALGGAAAVAAAAGAGGGGAWGDPSRLEAAMAAQALGGGRGVADEMRDLMVRVVADVAPSWLEAGFDDGHDES
jgi:hypothetical protein